MEFGLAIRFFREDEFQNLDLDVQHNLPGCCLVIQAVHDFMHRQECRDVY